MVVEAAIVVMVTYIKLYQIYKLYHILCQMDYITDPDLSICVYHLLYKTYQVFVT